MKRDETAHWHVQCTFNATLKPQCFIGKRVVIGDGVRETLLLVTCAILTGRIP